MKSIKAPELICYKNEYRYTLIDVKGRFYLAEQTTKSGVHIAFEMGRLWVQNHPATRELYFVVPPDSKFIGKSYCSISKEKAIKLFNEFCK